MIRVWYPADNPGTRQYYRSDTPATLKNAHLRLVKVHSYSGVPVGSARPRYPVLIFSPSWTGTCDQYTALLEELASHGFLVVGLDHPYGSDPTTFPDGRVVRSVLDKWLDYSSDESLEASVRVAEAQLQIRSRDVVFTVDELERLDRGDPCGLLTNRVDLCAWGSSGTPS